MQSLKIIISSQLDENGNKYIQIIKKNAYLLLYLI